MPTLYRIYLAVALGSIGLPFCTHQAENSNKPAVAPTVQPDNHLEHETKYVALSPQQIQAIGIQYGHVEQKALTATIHATGILSLPNNSKANATSLYGGMIRTLNIQIGDYVRKGQAIATIANPQFIQHQEEYLTINSRITFAEQEVQRQKELNEGNAGAMRNLQNTTAELNVLRTRKASLYHQIQLMGICPDSVSNHNLQSVLTVRSPVSGAISKVYGKIGSYVDVSSPVAEIIDNRSLLLHLDVFEKDLPLVKMNQTIHFTITNNPVNEYDAQIYSIGSAFENESKTIPVHARIKGNINGLIDGMNISAVVSLNDAISPAVPNDAIVQSDGKTYVFVRKDSGDTTAHTHHTEDDEEEENLVYFEKTEVVTGVSKMGFTAITPVTSIPKHAEIVVKGAFFINAKLTGTAAHEH